MDPHLHAGAAVFNAGYHHAAHDAWEQRWLDLDDGPDERFLHGLIQYTAVIHHGDTRNWTGMQGLADSAGTYLADLPDTYHGVALTPIREYLETLAVDPELIERQTPPQIVIDGTPPTLADLQIAAAFVAAPILAEALDYDKPVFEQGVAYARTDLEAGEEGSTFISLVMAFLSDAQNRPTIAQRLAQHVDRRETKERDVEDLF